MSTQYSIVQRMDGSYAIMDEDDDAPLVTIQFHNEAARVPEATKVMLIRQMFDPAPPPPMRMVDRLFWLFLGLIGGYGAAAVFWAFVSGWHK